MGHWRRGSASVLLLTGVAAAACTASTEDAYGDEDAHEAEAPLTSAEKNAICDAIPAPRPWSTEESTRLLEIVVRRFADLKRQNDALIASRGVGAYAGVRTDVMKAIASGDKRRAIDIVRPKVRPGHDAARIVDELAGTSCIGRVYAILAAAYADLDRGDEWRAIEKCGRAWDSDGLHVQQALIKNGWPSPTLPFVSDEGKLPGSPEEVAVHTTFLRAAARGSYYGTPVSTTTRMKNFLPTPGSATRADQDMLLAIGRSQFLAFGTFRGAYHVPLVVPAASVPADLAPPGRAGVAWLAARTRGEPFVLESHSLRQPWDATNFEVRPFNEVIAETFPQGVTYATGTLLFAPNSQSPLSGTAAPPRSGTCASSVLGRTVDPNACVQRPDGLWFRCADGGWAPSSATDAACATRHPAP